MKFRLTILLTFFVLLQANATGYSGTNPELMYLYGVFVGIILLYFGVKYASDRVNKILKQAILPEEEKTDPNTGGPKS